MAPFRIRQRFLTLLFVFWFDKFCVAERNKYFHISSLCGQKLYKKVDGAVLISNNEDSVDCVVTFQTDSILQRFMVRFDELQLDCNDHLFIYDGENVYGNFKANLTCNRNKHKVGPIFSKTNYVTFKYQTDGWGQIGNGFKLVLTAFKDAVGAACLDFRCSNNFCIDKELRCDGINHCGDNSDESVRASCYEETGMHDMLGMRGTIFMTLAITVVVLCVVCMFVVGFILLRRMRQRSAAAQVGGYPLQHGYLVTHQEKPPPYPGNLYPPAEGIGFNTQQEMLYYPTK